MQYEDATLRKLQMVMLDMIRDIDRVCEQLGVVYFGDSGTVLGACRHAGYIPWDDDVDLGMLRADYDRFCEQAPALLGERYVFNDPVRCPEQSALFTKITLADTKFYTDETLAAGIKQGIGLDLFPYDVLSADENVARDQRKRAIAAQRKMYLLHSARVNVPHKGVLGAVEKAGCWAVHAAMKATTSHEAILREFDEACAAGRENPSDDYICMAYATVGPFEKETLVPPRRLPFEQFPLAVPACPEAYLETMYGDWKTLPPADQRRNHAPVKLDFGPYA